MAIDEAALRAADEGADYRIGFMRVSDLARLGLLGEFLTELVEQRCLDDDLRVGHAHLALMEKDAKGRRLHGVGDIGIPQHDERVLAAHFQGKFLMVLGRFHSQLVAGLGRSREGDHTDARVGHELRADLGSRAGYDVEHPGRELGRLEDLCDLEPGDRRLLRRLQDKCIPRGERQGDFLHREQERRVEGRNAGNDAERAANGHRELSRL
jgi:hypothetical protein